MVLRIRTVFADTQKSQTEIAKELKVSPQYIWKIMNNDDVNPSEQFISSICREYNVNEEWLKNGTGPMYKPRSDNEIIAKFVNDFMESRSDDFRKRLINALSQLDEREWKVLEEIAKKMQ